jgi:hypothetical protein
MMQMLVFGGLKSATGRIMNSDRCGVRLCETLQGKWQGDLLPYVLIDNASVIYTKKSKIRQNEHVQYTFERYVR